MLAWLRRTFGGRGLKGEGSSAMVNAFEMLYRPGALKTRAERESRHEAALPAPTPGDRLLREGRLTVRRPDDDGGGRGIRTHDESHPS
jgi:hypothetical protein